MGQRESREDVERPYYGRRAFKYWRNESYLGGPRGFVAGWLIGMFLAYVFTEANWLVSVLIGVPSGLLGAYLGSKQEPYIRGAEITSTCVKCGEIAQVTAQSDGYIGFQCPRCKCFWKQREKRF